MAEGSRTRAKKYPQPGPHQLPAYPMNEFPPTGVVGNPPGFLFRKQLFKDDDKKLTITDGGRVYFESVPKDVKTAIRGGNCMVEVRTPGITRYCRLSRGNLGAAFELRDWEQVREANNFVVKNEISNQPGTVIDCFGYNTAESYVLVFVRAPDDENVEGEAAAPQPGGQG